MEEKEMNISSQKTKTKIQKAKEKMLSLFKKPESNEEGENSCSETFRITRTRSSGPNILETERSVFTVQDDGTKKKTVIKDIFAKVTTRNTKKQKQEDKENSNPKKMKLSNEGMVKQARNIGNILNHVTAHDKESQAMLIAKMVDKNGPDFAKTVTENSKEIQEGLKLTTEETASITAGLGLPDRAAKKFRTGMNKSKGWNVLASHNKVQALRRTKLPFQKEAWDFQKHMLYKNKQGNNKKTQKETHVAIVKDLKSYIQTHATIEKDELFDDTYLPVVIDGDAGGGRFVAEFTFLNRKDKSLKLHPFLLYEGTDNRENLQKTLGQLTQQIRSLEGEKIKVGTLEYQIKLFCLFDLCALNCVLGKQNHSATYPDAWTDVTKAHLSYAQHKDTPHTKESCKDINFVSLQDLETLFTNHAVKTGKTSGMNKTGKDFGSVINQNLIPLQDIFRFVPPLLHIIMGLGNNIFSELKNEIIAIDKKEATSTENSNADVINEHLKQLHTDKTQIEKEFQDTQVAHLISINDCTRARLLQADQVNEARKKAEEIYDTKGRTKDNIKSNCDAEMCIIFQCDELSKYDESFFCRKGCKLHLRCEGKILESNFPPENYECQQCKTGFGNKIWLEKKLISRKRELEEKVEIIKTNTIPWQWKLND